MSITTLVGVPLMSMVGQHHLGDRCRSRYGSCGVNWKCHLSLPVLQIERQHGTGVEVVARPHVGDSRVRGCRSPNRGYPAGIGRAGNPGRAAAALPGVAGPGLAPRFAGAGERYRSGTAACRFWDPRLR